MSLEQQIAALVTASNNLTSAVNGKIDEIDKRMDQAEQEFEEFTTVDFPQRVQDAQTVMFFIDPVNGNDSNTGTSSSNAFKTVAPLYSKTYKSGAIYKNVTIAFKTGYEYELNCSVYAVERINVQAWGGSSAAPGTLTLKQVAHSEGYPTQPFKAPFIYVNETVNGARSTVLKTFEFPAGHSWPKGDGQTDAWLALSGAMFRDVEKVKLDGVQVELYDMPLTSQYMNGSMGENASVGFVLAGNPGFYKKPAGPGSANYAHMPFLLSVYGPNAVPVDIVSGGHILAEGLTAFGELFNNLDHSNVRSTHTLS
ncbi:hypothetical protein ACYVMD_004572 [Vibrio parahaemolyticus]